MAAGLVSCKKESKEMASPKELALEQSSHTWYYFQDNKLNQIEKIQDVPSFPKKPWTEAVRISSFGCLPDNDDKSKSQKAYAIANRLGIIEFQDDKINLFKDEAFFAGKTAGNLVFWENNPIFSVYKSTFFGDSLRKVKGSLHSFLLQFDIHNKMILPVLNVENLALNNQELQDSSQTEITDFIWDGNTWTVCKKKSDDSSVEFSYMTFQPKKEISQVTPNSADQMLYKTPSDEETFRKLQSHKDFSSAPERIKSLLSNMQEKSSFILKCHTAGGSSPRTFENKVNEYSNPLMGNAILSDSWCAAFFQDGTLFLNGALSRSRIINKGKNIAFKLPKLPAGFVYNGFVFSGKNLYAFWEETEFYKTGRSGLISVPLTPIISKIEESK